MEYPSAENKLSDWFFEERNRVEGIEIVVRDIECLMRLKKLMSFSKG